MVVMLDALHALNPTFRLYPGGESVTSDERGSETTTDPEHLRGYENGAQGEIQKRQVGDFTKADPADGEGVARGLGVPVPKAL